jgi:hypothetical protein
MRRTRVIGCGVALACAFCAIVASGANAALPELGRCVKVAAGTGGFTRENCIGVSKTHTGEYEWAPGPGASPAFKETLHGPVLETVGKKKISCSVAFLGGEFTGPKSFKISEVTLQGCVLVGPNLPCYTNFVEPGTIEKQMAGLVGELGFIPGSKTAVPWAGWDLKPESQVSKTIIEFECGEGKAVPTFKVSLEGSVIGRTKPTNKMLTSMGLVYKQSAGIQNPEAFIGGSKDTLTEDITPTLNPENKTEEQAGLAAGGEFVPGEALEIKAKI